VLNSLFIKEVDNLEKLEFTVSNTEESITINPKVFWKPWAILIILILYTVLLISFIYEQEFGLAAIFLISLCYILFRLLIPLFFKLSISPT